jgi:hypothetical protein
MQKSNPPVDPKPTDVPTETDQPEPHPKVTEPPTPALETDVHGAPDTPV